MSTIISVDKNTTTKQFSYVKFQRKYLHQLSKTLNVVKQRLNSNSESVKIEVLGWFFYQVFKLAFINFCIGLKGFVFQYQSTI